MSQEAPKVVLGVTGSIAAYKAAELTRLLQKQGMEVSVVMTESAEHFVGPLTFEALTGRPVASGRFEKPVGGVFQHIDLSGWADVMVIAPCTANVIGKLASGIADDVLTSTVLAFKGKLIVAPAMNTGMWEHPAVRANLKLLKERGVHVMPVGRGDLACGHVGEGRLCELDDILAEVQASL